MRIGGSDEAELGGHLLADERDALEELAAVGLVDERDQAVADLELERVERQRLRDGARPAPAAPSAPRRPRRRRRSARLVAALRRRPKREADEHGRERAGTASFGRPGKRPNAPITPPAMNERRAAGASSCFATSMPRFESASLAARVTMMPVAVEIRSAGICATRPSPIDEQREGAERVARSRMPCWTTPIAMPPSDVDRDDDQAGDRVALDELARRRPSRRRSRPPAGSSSRRSRASLVGDQAGVQVGVDRHLLAGHGVEGEARRDFGDAPGALRDDDELDRRRGSGRRRCRRRSCRRRRTAPNAG